MSELIQLSSRDDGPVTLMLDRADVHNAFNAELIAGLTETFVRLAASPPRALVLTGAGRSFSAGADLGWMRAMAEASKGDNRDDAKRLAAMFRALDQLPCPTIAKVNGAAFGGGVGLISCCDIAVAADHARFGLTEVRLGLIPATIAPFVIARIGAGNARRYMLTGERFDAERACAIGLLHETCPADALDDHVDRLLNELLACGPNAVTECKRLIREVGAFSEGQEALDARTAEWIARLRVSDEGQAGLRAFLEKRRPEWDTDTLRRDG